MATLFRPVRPVTLPPDAKIVDREIIGKDKQPQLWPHVQIGTGRKAEFYPLTKDKSQYLVPGAKWAADVRMANDKPKRVRFSSNYDASVVMLGNLLKKIELERSGVHDRYTDHRKRPLSELLNEYKQYHLDEDHTEKQASQTCRRCELVFAGTGFILLCDLDGSLVGRWLADLRDLPKSKGGFGPQTSNHYASALKSFGNWLVKSRKLPESPFRHLGRVNVEVDVRHVRRPLSAEEFVRLVDSTRAGTEFKKLSGPDRAMLYTVAGMTGLRASELASLNPESFALQSDPPIVVVEAGYSKHRRRDKVPLHPDLATELAAWLTSKPNNARLWPGKWAENNEAVDLIRRDLEIARAAWILDAVTDEDRTAREQSDFLLYRNHDGAVADFHALRHTFVTNLVNSGCQPKDAKELARHSTITLTMDRYSHVGIRDTALAVGKLALPTSNRPSPESTILKATGTDNAISDLGERAVKRAVDNADRRGELETNDETGTESNQDDEGDKSLEIAGNRGEFGIYNPVDAYLSTRSTEPKVRGSNPLGCTDKQVLETLQFPAILSVSEEPNTDPKTQRVSSKVSNSPLVAEIYRSFHCSLG